MKQLLLILIFSYGSVSAMNWRNPHQITPEQQAVYQNLLPIISKLKAKLNAYLDEAEAAQEVQFSDNCPPVNSISEQRMQFDEPHLPQAATKQGLLLIYNRDLPLFKLLSPGGLHILAGYYGMSGKMQWDDYDSLKKELLTKYLTGEAADQVRTNSDFWQDSQAFKINAVEGEKIADLVMGTPITDEMFNEVK